jgi:hypothetical protein
MEEVFAQLIVISRLEDDENCITFAETPQLSVLWREALEW